MRAVIRDRYGPPEVLRLEELAAPEPKGDQVRVAVRAVSVNAPDWRLMPESPGLSRLYLGLLRPKVRTLGSDVAGVVEATGPCVTQLRSGDEVFGDLSRVGFGGFAECVCASEKVFARKPPQVSFELAAATPMAGVTALQALRDSGGAQAGQKVLIAGASGGVGTFTVQVAKILGLDVTAVCSAAKVEQARSLGADRVIDYSQEDFTRGSERYDLIVAINGNRSLREYRRVLAPRGTYVMVGGGDKQLMQSILWGPVLSLFGKQRFRFALGRPSQADLAYLGELLTSGRLRPVIDRHYPLHEVPAAIRYVKSGHATGKVIIDVEPRG